MKFKGIELVLDNFREVLKSYSLDIQDVVRSAILDGKDISEYINPCKNSAYRLDQIRLGMKEGVPSSFFCIKNGDLIFRIRQLKHKGRDLSWIEEQVNRGVLSDENLATLISWVEKEYSIEGLDISIIPKSMIESFEYGLSKGADMKLFNNGRVYSAEYVRLCLALKENQKSNKVFISGAKLWDISVLKALVGYSKSADDVKWGKLMSSISAETPKGKVPQLIKCINNGISVKELGKREWHEGSIDLILTALDEGLDCNKLIAVGPDAGAVAVKYNELSLQKSKEKRVGGILRKG